MSLLVASDCRPSRRHWELRFRRPTQAAITTLARVLSSHKQHAHPDILVVLFAIMVSPSSIRPAAIVYHTSYHAHASIFRPGQPPLRAADMFLQSRVRDPRRQFSSKS
ncbi:hypothetical protein K458DRAFT_413745 [Lentithecium fluviatile CBS 122367]|uniref:Uncharacterized protein n=1 Tax=Lentithecium fluviatile CBS 122367 TaxID=1168545 RepID=A0A6G1JH60_9PLEO|nr:hypothetical protein K458DRAFT_413745 [Lentithecium fluviatile CBS 122367]